MCLGARAGSHEMTGQTCYVDEELGDAGMNAVRGALGGCKSHLPPP